MKSLTKSELAGLLAVAVKHNTLDALMLSVMFNHGLRISEATGLTKDNIVDGYLVIQRLKGSRKTNQPLLANEKAGLEALASKVTGRFWLAEYAQGTVARVIAWRLVQKYGKEAGIPQFKCHPHVLKHTTGRLAYEGGMGIPELQKYIGHENGANTMKYAEAPEEVACSAFAAAVGQ
jgi:type 1 fimbriae regulatory protein FimB